MLGNFVFNFFFKVKIISFFGLLYDVTRWIDKIFTDEINWKNCLRRSSINDVTLRYQQLWWFCLIFFWLRFLSLFRHCQIIFTYAFSPLRFILEELILVWQINVNSLENTTMLKNTCTNCVCKRCLKGSVRSDRIIEVFFIEVFGALGCLK